MLQVSRSLRNGFNHFVLLLFSCVHCWHDCAIENNQCAFSVIPQPCHHNCTCHRSPWDRANIFDCRNKSLTRLPQTVLEDTDWLLLSGNNFGSLNEVPDYLTSITLLNLSSSNITEIGETVMRVISENVKNLDIRKNKLKTLPESITKSNKTSKLWISGNPYECNCDMICMKDWLMDSENVVKKENVTCSTDKIKGKLNEIIIITVRFIRSVRMRHTLSSLAVIHVTSCHSKIKV